MLWCNLRAWDKSLIRILIRVRNWQTNCWFDFDAPSCRFNLCCRLPANFFHLDKLNLHAIDDSVWKGLKGEKTFTLGDEIIASWLYADTIARQFELFLYGIVRSRSFHACWISLVNKWFNSTPAWLKWGPAKMKKLKENSLHARQFYRTLLFHHHRMLNSNAGRSKRRIWK